MTSAPILSLLSLLAVAPMQEAQTAKPTFRIRGTVLDVCYVPVAGARVGFIAGKDILAEAESDERGHFRLEVGATGPGRLVVRHDGFARVAVTLELTEGRTLVSCGELRLPPARDLTGKVTGPDDEPLAGARIELLHADRGLFSLDRYETTSDAEGGFRFADAPLGDVLLFAWASGTELLEDELCHAGGGPVGLDLRRAPKTVLELRLEGEAPPQGRIRYRLVREFRGRNPLPRALASGSFEGSVHRLEGLPNGEYGVTLEADEAVLLPDDARAVLPVDKVLSFHQVAPHAVTLSGRLLDEEAEPARRVGLRAAWPGGSAEFRTDDEGRFTREITACAGTMLRLHVLTDNLLLAPGGSHDLRQLAQYVPAAFRSWRSFKVEACSDLELECRPGRIVEGTVLDPNGAPAAYTELTVEQFSPQRTPKWMAICAATSDQDGHFRLPPFLCSSGETRLRAAGHRGRALAELDPDPEAASYRMRILLEAPIEVTGILRDHDGKPIPGRAIELVPHDQATDFVMWAESIRTRTDHEGRYRLFAEAPGRHHLTVVAEDGRWGHPGGVTGSFELTAGQRLVHDLRRARGKGLVQ